jgi:hypothetical protein
MGRVPDPFLGACVFLEPAMHKHSIDIRSSDLRDNFYSAFEWNLCALGDCTGGEISPTHLAVELIVTIKQSFLVIG